MKKLQKNSKWFRLSNEKKSEIVIYKYNNPFISNLQIAKEYGVSAQTINNIVNDKFSGWVKQFLKESFEKLLVKDINLVNKASNVQNKFLEQVEKKKENISTFEIASVATIADQAFKRSRLVMGESTENIANRTIIDNMQAKELDTLLQDNGFA